MKVAGRLACVAIGAAALTRAADLRRERRRRLALMPSGIALSAGITFRESKRLATLRGLTETYPTGRVENSRG